MQTSTDPYPANSESLSTTGAGEIQRLRYQLSNLLGLTYWFRNDENINFAHAAGKTNVSGSGFARHVTAVGYHAWAGSARFPVYSTVNFHTTGIWFPRAGTQPRWTVAHHLAVSVGSGIDRDQTGIEVARFHLEALQLHHTVALRFAHSNAGLAAWQYPHVTALQVRRPQPGPDGALPPTADISDQIIVGHRGVALQLQGASLIPAANRLVAYGPSGEYVEAKTISGDVVNFVTHQAGQLVFAASTLHTAAQTVGNRFFTGGSAIYMGTGAIVLGLHAAGLTPLHNAAYASNMPKAWARIDMDTAGMPLRDGFNIASVTDVGAGIARIAFTLGFSGATNYAVTAFPTWTDSGAGASLIICVVTTSRIGMLANQVEILCEGGDAADKDADELSVVVFGTH